MISTLTCQHCGLTIESNPRIKRQKYCSSRACQNARRFSTHKVRVKKSSASRSLRCARNMRWRHTRPAYAYQKDYRENHPEYVKRNRDLQRERNKKSQKDSVSMIVKTYALSPQPLRDGVYTGFEVKSGKIVKTYAFRAQMQVQPERRAVYPANPV